MLEFILKKAVQDGFFTPVSQLSYKQKGVSHTATLYCDGVYFVQIESENAVANKKICDLAGDLTLSAAQFKGETAAAVKGRVCGKKYCLYAAFNGDDYIFEEITADTIEEKEGQILVTDNLRDMACRLCQTKIEYDGTKFTAAEKKLTAQKPHCANDKLLPYYFLEAVLCGDFPEAIKFLSETNYKDITPLQLKNFFGGFTEIVQNRYESALAKYPAVARRQTDSFYVVEYYEFIIKDGLIENIIGAGIDIFSQ